MIQVNDDKNFEQMMMDVVAYVKKNFKKPVSYDDVYEKYERWGEKAQKAMLKGKFNGKPLYHWGNLETVIALCEYLNADTTAAIDDKLLESRFIEEFASYQRNKIFDRNKQVRPDENDQEIEPPEEDITHLNI